MKRYFILTWLVLVMISGTSLAQSYNIETGSLTFTKNGDNLEVTQNGNTVAYEPINNVFPNIIIYGNSTPTANTILIDTPWIFSSGSETIITLSNVVIHSDQDVPIELANSSLVKMFLAPGTSNILKTTAQATETESFSAIRVCKAGGDPLLKIKGSGTLVAEGAELAAGIGGDYAGDAGEIRIEDNVVVIARGGLAGAGIGGAEERGGGRLTISGNAVVIAHGGNGGDCSWGYPVGGAAGIGGGGPSDYYSYIGGSGGTITISDNARVTAYGGTSASGIGGGADSELLTGSISIGISNKVIAVSDGARPAIDDTSLGGNGYVMLLNFFTSKEAGTTNTLYNQYLSVLANTVVPLAYQSLAFSVAQTNIYLVSCNNIYQSQQRSINFPVTLTGINAFDDVADTNTINYTLSAPVAVPYTWIAQHYPLESEANYETLANTLGVNGLTNWQSYVAGLMPTNAQSAFTASITLTNGTPTITWTPNLQDQGRTYTIQGKALLTSPSWGATNSASRFFKVSVDLP